VGRLGGLLWGRRRASRVVALVAVAGLVAAACAGGGSGGDGGEAAGPAEAERPPAEWLRVGLDLANTRAVTGETALDVDSVAGLAPAWDVRGIDGMSGTPAVSGGVVYFGDWTGHVRALNRDDGTEVWNRRLGDRYIGGSVALDGDHVYAGTFDGRIVALARDTGEPVWDTQIGDHPKAVIFGSPVVVDGLVVVGVASFEVFVTGNPNTFRGHIVALDAATGAERWRFYVTAGDATQAAGVSIWSSPAIDTERGVAYIGTGQSYGLPASPLSDSLLALDLQTGEEVWHTQFTADDAWTLAQPTGLDADVGAMPNLFPVNGKDAVGVGDKAGTYRALDRETGEILWEAPLTPGGTQGGVMASAAVAGGIVYVTSNDASRDADMAALDADTGEEVWRAQLGAHVTGPVTWANGVLYVSDDSGRIAAYDAADGSRLWSYDVPFPAAGGIAVVDGVVYAGWGWWLANPPANADGGVIAFAVPPNGAPGTSQTTEGEAGDPGATVYRQRCAACHGGSGEGATGPSMVDVDDRLTRDEHITVVREGRGSMPAWDRTLTEEEIEAVVDYEREVLANGSG
jgi:polyvinyl alcohol dehydrogenase (cytochrome)